MSDDAEISKLIAEAEKYVGTCDWRDRHKMNILKRNAIMMYVHTNLKCDNATKIVRMAEYFGFTDVAMRYTIRTTKRELIDLVKILPTMSELLAPQLQYWYRGSFHTLQTKGWYQRNIPSVANPDEYDIEYGGDAYIYTPRKDTELEQRMRLCNQRVQITDVTISNSLDIVGIKIAQDGGRHTYILSEFIM